MKKVANKQTMIVIKKVFFIFSSLL